MKVATSTQAGQQEGSPHYRGKRIAVVVPAYNEEKLIGETLGGIPDYVARVYAVNDGSSDRTGEIIEDYARRDSRIVPIHHNPNRGGSSDHLRIQAGGQGWYGYRCGDGGDNQMDPAQLPSLLDPIVEGRANYTKGNRLISEAFRTG